MRFLLRPFFINAAAIWLTAQFLDALDYSNSLAVLFLAGAALALVNLIVKPLIKILTLPINLLTLGVFSWLIDVLMLYIVTIIVPSFKIEPYTFPGFSYQDFSLPSLFLPKFWSLVLCSVVISFISSFLNWLFKR